MRRLRVCLFVAPLLSVVGLVGCELSSNLGGDPDFTTSVFSRQIQPALNQKCTSCHGLLEQEGGLSLASWTDVFDGSQYGDVVVPFSSARSLLLRMATERVGGAHPGELGSDTLSQNELQILREWIDEGAPDDGGAIAFEDAEHLLYVANQEAATVSIIDMNTNVVIRVVDLRDHGYSATSKPHHVAVEPDGSHWYVSLIGENRVARFNRDNVLAGDFEFETPGMLSINPVADWLYAGRSLSAPNPPASIGKIRRSEMTGELIPVVFSRPHALTTDPMGAYMYSSSLGQNQIIAYETASEDITFAPVAGPIHSFVQHVVAPDGGMLAASAQLTNQMLFFDLSVPAAPALAWSVGVNASPWHPVFSPDGSNVYVGNKDANTVTVVSVANRRVESIITGDGLAEPHGSAISPDGNLLYVSNRNTSGSYTPRHDFGDNANDGTVVVIDRAGGRITKVLEVGAIAAGLGNR